MLWKIEVFQNKIEVLRATVPIVDDNIGLLGYILSKPGLWWTLYKVNNCFISLNGLSKIQHFASLFWIYSKLVRA